MLVDMVLLVGRGEHLAVAWVLFAIIFLCTLAQSWVQRRWDHYEAEEGER
ncbi:MAG: hypothetical protein HGA45_14235 [Chloroflexales bacterium]|nr:hypothetical protein [Chloroflexales bacterium]